MNGFVCRRCGACCRIKDGIVRVDDADIAAMAAFLSVPEESFIAAHTQIAPDRRGLVLLSREDGACEWLSPGGLCAIEAAKPRQCRDFPHGWTNPDSSTLCPALREIAECGRMPNAKGDMK